MTTKDFYIQVILEQLTESAIIRSNNWESENPCIEVFFSQKSELFSGKVDRGVWKSFAECFEQDPVEFFELNKKALSCQEESKKYKYSLKNKSEQNLTLTWSKALDDGAIAKCGEIILSVCQNLSLFDFVRNCVGIVTDLTHEVQVQTEKALKTEEESAQLVKEYEKTLEGRVAAEEELLAKFHALLNSKKRKIRDLQIEQY